VATTLDSEVLRDLFGTEELRAAFDARALVQSWLDVERALAEAEAEVGVIPADAAARIAAEADAALYDLAVLREGIAESQHPLVPLIRALAGRCGEHGNFVHWGATTQDVIDTALVLQLRTGLAPIRRDLDRAVAAGADLARAHGGAAMPGRTHGQHAVPITFGLKAASWTDELLACAARLEAAEAGVATAQLGGAAGTLAALGPDAAPVRTAFCRLLGLAESDVPWHTNRARLRDLGHALAEIASAGERIAAEIVLLQSTEVAEVAEPSTDAHVGSSTMPQKRNPMTSEYVVATARLVRGATSVLDASPAHAHERDMGAWAVEWIALPQEMILTGGLLEKLTHTLEGLVVETDRMLANLELTRGRIMAEAAMMALARSLGHERAHAVVTAAVRRADTDELEFSAVLRDDPAVTVALTPDELDLVLDPLHYLGLARETAAAAAAFAEKRAPAAAG
jgi:3-carboxy-cis,cis-muconate cycloisomerase